MKKFIKNSLASASAIVRRQRIAFLAVITTLLTLAGAVPARATVSDAATAGVASMGALIPDINALGAAFILIVIAGVVWMIVSSFLRKSKSH